MHKNSNEFLEIFAENVRFTKILVKNNGKNSGKRIELYRKSSG